MAGERAAVVEEGRSGASVERRDQAAGISLAVVLLLGAVLRLWLAFHDDGIYWPDEIYQSLEPAHRLVFGYGMVAWEFIDGARNWALPGFVAALMKVSGGSYLSFVRVVFCLIGVATSFGSYRLARAMGASSRASVAAASLWALAAPAIYFAPRAMSETASALPVVFGFALLARVDATRRQRIVGASLLGLAVLLRLQNGLFCVGALALFVQRRQWRALGEVGGVLLVWAFLFGLLDKLTWGDWFHSAFVYLRFNLVEGKGAQWGTAPFAYYARVLWTSMPTVTPVLLVLSLLSARRAPVLLATAVMFLVLHAFIPHKEYRFMLPAIPVLCALAAVGIDSLPARLSLGALAVAGLGAFISAAGFHNLTFGQLGQYEDSKPKVSAYDDAGPVNRLLLAASHLPDVCGLKIETAHLAWTGGYSYLHLNVPLFHFRGPPRESRRYNYMIAAQAWARGLDVRASDESLVLVRLFDGPCVPSPDFSWRLP